MGSFAGFGTPVKISQSRAPIHRSFQLEKTFSGFRSASAAPSAPPFEGARPRPPLFRPDTRLKVRTAPSARLNSRPRPSRGGASLRHFLSLASQHSRQPQDRQISRVSILSTFTRPLPVPRDLTLPRNRRAHRKHDRCLERAVRNPAGGADPTHRVAQIVPTRQKQQREARRALRGAGARGGHPRPRRARRARVRPLEHGRVHHHPASDCERPRAPLLRGRLHRALPHPFRRGAHQVHAKPNPQRAHGHEHLPQARVGAGHRIVQGTRRAQRPPRPQRRAEEARRGGGIRR